MNENTEIIVKDISPVVLKAKGLSIKDEKDMTEAVELLSVLNKGLDRVVLEKEKVTKPLNEALKQERARWKPFETMCEEAIEIVRKKMTVYQTEKTRLVQEEEAKLAARVGEGKGKLKMETASRMIDEIDAPEKSVAAESGSVRFEKVKMFRIVDLSLLPTEYILPNEVKIRAAMKKGEEIPGVEYYTEERPKNFR